MAKRGKWQSTDEIRAEREARQAEWFPAALKVMETPLGRALRKPGVTFNYWSNSTPANIWVENKRGTQLFHSNENDYNCPVRAAFKTLRSFLDDADNDLGAGGESFVLSPEFITKVDQFNLDAKTEPVKKIARRGPRL